MTIEEFIRFVDELPSDCIEAREDKRIIFHLPRAYQSCPKCGSHDNIVDRYRKQKVFVTEGKEYIYNKRRYKCNACQKTFSERNPFIGDRQETIGTPLKKFRGNKGIPMSAMVKELGIPQYAYQWLEDGELSRSYRLKTFPPPSIEVAEKAAHIVGISLEEAFGSREAIEKRIFEAQAAYVEAQQKRAEERARKREVREAKAQIQNRLAELSLEDQRKMLGMMKLQLNYSETTGGRKEGKRQG